MWENQFRYIRLPALLFPPAARHEIPKFPCPHLCNEPPVEEVDNIICIHIKSNCYYVIQNILHIVCSKFFHFYFIL